ncbi:MAG TPA: DUF4349 domain-containing protein [Terriglobales bacterium]|nr:DUF4349 domain-containing protein [Terriglobales bacterium]
MHSIQWIVDRKAALATGFLSCMLLWVLLVGTQIMTSRKHAALSESAGLASVSGGFSGFLGGQAEAEKKVALRSLNASAKDGALRNMQESVLSPSAARKVTRKGLLRLRVAEQNAFFHEGTRIATTLGGFVIRSSQSDANWSESSLVISVPAAHFDDAMKRLQGLARKVDEATEESEDVTKRYFDMNATLRNYRAEEAQFLSILRQAQRVQDVVLVTDKLLDVRGRIEQTQGDFRFLQQEIAMSTITISVRPEAAAGPLGVEWHAGASVKQAYREMLVGFVTFANLAIAAIFYLPVFLAWVLTLAGITFIGWRGLLRLKRLLSPTPAPAD